MNRVVFAVRAFFRTLFDASFSVSVGRLLAGDASSTAPPCPAPPSESKPSASKRSDALTLMAALQREARFIDFINESLDEYSDAQIGAVARDVHRDCGATLKRLFDFEPLLTEPENATVDVPVGFDVGCYQLTGNVAGDPPFQGQLVHHGWKAKKCAIATWSGTADASLVVAPAEVEVK